MYAPHLRWGYFKLTLISGERGVMNGIRIARCDVAPTADKLNGVLDQYYTLVVARMQELGFAVPADTVEAALAEFWANVSSYLPPKGCLVLAWRSEEIVGCGMLKRFDDTTGELKRVFVTDAVRGTGTGRALIEAREQAARELGMTRLIADTLTPNVEMRDLYPKLGFTEIIGPIETTTYLDQPELRPYLHFFVKDL